MFDWQKPTTNFQAVRDGRTSPDFWFDLDLSAPFDRQIDISGNSFYIDANPADGVCTAYFQDTNSDRTPTPFYISPGFIARIPFTQMRFVNSISQPGRKIRVVYGTDTEFQPGSVSQVSLAADLQTRNVVNVGTRVNSNAAALNTLSAGIYTLGVLVFPASNVNGLRIDQLHIAALTGAGVTSMTGYLFADPSNTPIVSENTTQRTNLISVGALGAGSFVRESRYGTIDVPAGMGLYWGGSSFGGTTTLQYTFSSRLL